MKFLPKAFFGMAIYAAVVLSGCQIESQDPFVRHIEQYRFSKDSFFRIAEQSPLDPKPKRNFVSLKYYDPNPKYALKAHFEPLPAPQSLFIEETDGNDAEYYKMGYLRFEVEGKQCSLAVYQKAKYLDAGKPVNTYFVPFWDETNGKETYEGGRFMDVEIESGAKEVELDFNFAYNPYCAYSHHYTCPIPTAENKLPVSIMAGEKVYNENLPDLF